MRLLIKNCQRFSIRTVSEYVKLTRQNIDLHDKSKFVQFQSIFYKMYVQHLQQSNQMLIHRKKLRNISLMSQAPASNIAEYFFKKSVRYSEEFLTQAFESLGKAYNISRADNSGTLDLLGYKLFNTPEFLNLSEQLKYGLKFNKIKFQNLTKIIRSLINMEYVDYQIISLLLIYTQRYISGKQLVQPLRQWAGDRQFQIQKKNYYKFGQEELLRTIRNSNQLSLALQLVKQIHAEVIKEKQKDIMLRQNSAGVINQLIQEISNTNKNFRKLTESIINIRREYLKMVEFSSDSQILRNPLLNFELLEVEQKLLQAKLISIEDIKNPPLLKKQKYQLQRIEQIILSVLDIDRLDYIFTYIDKNTIYNNVKQEGTMLQIQKLGQILQILSDFASLDRHLYSNLDGKSLISLKWEKTLVRKNTIEEQQNLKQKLNVARIFRKVYKDIFNFVSNNFETIKNIYSSTDLGNKIQFLNALCKLGLHEQAVIELNSSDKSYKMNISQLPFFKFSQLLHLLNNIGIFSKNSELKQEVYIVLQNNTQLEEVNTLNTTIRYTIDVLNYLIQNHNIQDTSIKQLYQHQLDILQKKVDYYNSNYQQIEHLTQAIKILALELPHKYSSHLGVITYLNNLATNQFRYNPYYQILRQTCYKYAGLAQSINSVSPYIKIGYSNGYNNGLILSNSDETSIEGDIRSGDLNSYIIRLQLVNKAKLFQISVNSIYNIDYKNSNFIKIRPTSQLEQKLNNIFNENNQEFQLFYDKIYNSLTTILSYYETSLITNRILFKLKNILILKRKQVNSETSQEEITRKGEIILEILDLKKLITLLEENKVQIISEKNRKIDQTEETLNQKLRDQNKKQNKSSKNEIKMLDNKKLRTLFKDSYYFIEGLTSNLNEQISLLLSKSQLKDVPKSIDLKGKRLTIQTIQSGKPQLGNITIQIINSTYYSNKSYFEYNDWRQLVEKEYNYLELDYDKLSNLNKILVKKLCPRLVNKITLLPVVKHKERIQLIDIDLTLLANQKIKINQNEANDLTQAGQKLIESIINLQNFKHQLKISYSKQQIIEYLFSFKFIYQLKQDASVNESLLLKRNPEQYFLFLEQQSEQSYLQSPYAKYIVQKLSKTDKVRQLLERRKLVRMNQRLLFQKGQITSAMYYQQVGQVENDIIAALEQLKNKVLDNMKDSLLEGNLKMIKIQKEEIEEFQKIINRQHFYNRQFDQDFIYANGKYSLALNLKRGRAQNNFIKFSILKKVAEGKPLKESDKQFVHKWKKQMQKGISNFIVYPRYSNLQIKDLFLDDQQKLKLKTTSLVKNSDMLLIDLIMELNHFLDQNILYNFEKNGKADILFHLYGIPKQLFMNSSNKEFSQLSIEKENAIIKEKSKLSDSQLDKIQQMFKIYKTEGFKERIRYDVLCKNFRQNIGKMNEQSQRNQLISQYVCHLDGQFLKQYNPTIIGEMKDRQIDTLWKEIFKKPYHNCYEQILKTISKKILLRLEAIGKSTPPFFGNIIVKILCHPQADQLTRQTLIAAIEEYKIDLNLDSEDIIELSQLKSKEEKSSLQIQTIINTICNKTFTETLNQKMNLLL